MMSKSDMKACVCARFIKREEKERGEKRVREMCVFVCSAIEGNFAPSSMIAHGGKNAETILLRPLITREDFFWLDVLSSRYI